MKRGEGAKALGLDAFASTIGGMIGALVLMFVAIPMSQFALLFRTPDKFSLVFLAVVSVVIVARGSIWRSVVTVTLGMMISTVGLDNMMAQGRFVFGSAELIEGVRLLPAVIGLFAICELLVQSGAAARGAAPVAELRASRRDFMPTWAEIREIGFWTYVKSSVIGVLIGMLRAAAPRWRPSSPMPRPSGARATRRSTATGRTRAWPLQRRRTTPCAAAPSSRC